MTTEEPQICAGCAGDIPWEDVVWIDPDGEISLDGEGADPYHEECIP